MERTLVPETLPHLLRAVHAALVEHREEVDALNVFPVPDGDTGTNLAATAAAVVEALPARGAAPADLLVRAALRSARGNSGVIFSQVVRAVVEAVDQLPADRHGDVEVLAHALEQADVLARDAVADPVEGTILTAISVAARSARAQADAGEADLDAVLAAVSGDVAEAVRETREQLDVLRDAGVVDAGARGLEVVMSAVHSLVTGEQHVPEPLDRVVPLCHGEDLAAAHVERFPIEVQYVLEAGADAADVLRGRLASLGDSVVVVEADGFTSAHVHTADPEAAIAAADDLGGATEVRTTDLRDQLAPTAELDVVAVLPVGGLHDLAAGAGCAIVAGAAGALPSVDELLRAARSCAGDEVVVLPGHHNVVPTARQAARVAAQEGGPTIHVVAEADHPLVVLSCLAVGSADPEQLAKVAAGCRGGEVVAAVRDADTPVGPVRTGQPVVAVRGRVVAVAEDVSQALGMLLAELDAPTAELLTVAVGADSPLGVPEVMMAAVEHAGEAELDVLDGGQRPALLLAVAEG